MLAGVRLQMYTARLTAERVQMSITAPTTAGNNNTETTMYVADGALLTITQDCASSHKTPPP
eukprot:SAG31_NODE_249_length_19118_cov_47.456195_6_plen_62_part_00